MPFSDAKPSPDTPHRATMLTPLRPPRVVRRRVDGRAEAMKSRLVAVTINLLATVGDAHTSTQKVCEMAGVSNGALFRHFPTRDDLLTAVAVHLSTQLHACFPTPEPLPAQSAEAERYWADVLAHMWEHTRGPVGTAWREILLASRTSDRIRQVTQRAVEQQAMEASRFVSTLLGGHAEPTRIQEIAELLVTWLHILHSEAMAPTTATATLQSRHAWMIAQVPQTVHRHTHPLLPWGPEG